MKDLRNDFNYEDEHLKMPRGHLNRFEKRLNTLNAQPKHDLGMWLQRIAAVLIIGILVSNFWFNIDAELGSPQPETNETMDLNDFSPELGKFESYLKSSINYELATLDLNNYEDVALSYLEELKKIEKDYEALQNDLRVSGFNVTIVEAMIENLELRLELLQNLKLKLNELKTLSHENNTPQQL
jgi:hypothetical protein